MCDSPPPQVIQLRELLRDLYEREANLSPNEGVLVDLMLCQALVDNLIRMYPELTMDGNERPLE